ncbi:hypothetical protein KUTeg_010444 [Tegillarca granosa]|uniref:Purinergic receptor n=1 Tax=Tegillarca granosa TaxID=220873 RepID=A0ABQ9F6R5_TEGGR|nr:hypothetical protein KUTeg_010444 [Tegillarca granosa]
MAPNIVRSAFGVFFEYDTPRIVHIRSKKVGVFNRFIQLCIIAYVIGVESAVTTKLKGVAYIEDSKVPILNNTENNAFFVTTNIIVTPDQVQTVCPEDPKIAGATCNTDADCEKYKGIFIPGGNGVANGSCDMVRKTCFINSWCPVEDGAAEIPNPPLLKSSENFTVFVKNNIEFPKFNVKRRNLPSKASDEYLKTCKFDFGQNVDCPIFRLGTIVKEAGENYTEVAKENDKELSSCRYNPDDSLNKYCPIFVLSEITSRAGENYTDMAKEGGVMQILITWNCNLDFSEDECLPKYSFRRLDMFGIKFVVTVTGTAGKFDAEPLFMNIGSGLALLSIATIICDIFVLYVLKAKTLYKSKKYLDVEGDDAYKPGIMPIVNDLDFGTHSYNSIDGHK